MLEEKQLFNIRNYFLVIWKRRWIIFCVALIVFVSNLIKLAAETPLFTASAKILIEQPMQPLGGQYGYQLYSDFGTLTETQRQLLHSREFLRKVANELNQQEPSGAGESGKVDIYEGEPFHTMLSGLRSITSLFRKNPSASTTAPARSAAEASEKSLFAYRPLYGAGQIGAGLSVQGIKDTDIFLIVSTRARPPSSPTPRPKSLSKTVWPAVWKAPSRGSPGCRISSSRNRWVLIVRGSNCTNS